MKTLGELKIGDSFYTINWEGGYIYSVQPHIVSIIAEIKIGMIIKWIDPFGDLHGRTIEKTEYDSLIASSAYCESICADIDYVKKILNKDYEKFTNNYNRILNELNNENKS